ncbi:CW-type zinc-finger protein [Quillaja saponaria]|uniref:CW-type zinc-finger protein n=1 Tax=Quillaja saponaria TaxID=32244 RepID=A0AAD7Q121_QUISA|nr:CW-type zinc-finger protein [Quillaja saponaria]
MITLGSRDARKGLDLGFGSGGGGGEMEETELEEGEACSYPNNEDYDSSIDPDVALSYIDEKLQNVLGHFQKDFEGGVSAENLGAKFGGYGSFLPTYQRSPAWPHPKTPPKVHNYNMTRSPHNILVEGGQGTTRVPSTAPESVGLQPSSTSSSWLPGAKAPSMNDSVNQEVCVPATHTEAFTSKYEFVNKKPTDMSDQKPLKVRIKVGADSLSTRKNAAIYSGLGLDVSPSSSLDDSPSESEGISGEPQDVPFESPTSILQIMTSFPVLLSPLPDDVIHLTEKETREQDSISVFVPKDDAESSGMLVHDSNFVKNERKVSGGKKMMMEKNNLEFRVGNNEDAHQEIRDQSKKGPNIDALTCEELVSETLKLPILSNSHTTVNDPIKGMGRPFDILREAKKGVVREKAFSDEAQKTQVEPTFMEEVRFVEKAKSGTGGKAQDKDTSFSDDPVCTVKDKQHEGEKTCETVMDESNVSKGRRVPNAEVTEAPKKSYQKATSCEQDNMTLPVVKEHSFPGRKKKLKGSHIHGTVAEEVQSESLKLGSSMVSKTKKSCDVDSYISKNDTGNVKVQKDHGKARDRYRDFFGELEEEGDRMESSEMPYEDNVKDSEVIEKSTSALNGELRERSSGKKLDKPSTSHLYPKTATNVAGCTGNGSVADADNGKGVPITMAPVMVEDKWVQCDKCQRWRLLPLGTNTDDWPEKWLCSMLYWLPKMNRCSVSEDETTKALIALYQAPAPESQINLQSITGSVITEGSLSTVQHPDQYLQNYSLHPMASGKKKLGKEASNSTYKDGSMQLSHSSKKNLQLSLKSRSLYDVNGSPLLSDPDVQQLKKSSDLAREKHKSKQKVLDIHSDRGDTKNLKVKNRRDPDQVCSGAAKKSKAEGVKFTDGDWTMDQGAAARNTSHRSSRSLPTTSAGKDWPKYKDHSSTKDSIYDAKDKLQLSVKNAKDKGRKSLDGFLDKDKTDVRDSGKKRPLKEYQVTQTNLGSLHSTGYLLHESRDSVKEEFSENEGRKEKKARLSKSDGKESSKSKGSGRTDKKSSHTKNQKPWQDVGSSLSQRSLDGNNCLKRDLESVQASVTATSSSSKVSGSHRTKASFQEVKGSPVESVSSSPMRISNPDKFTVSKRELIGKDDSHDARLYAIGSPRRCSDDEDDGGSDRSGTAKKDKSFAMTHHRSHESSMLDIEDRENDHISDTKPNAKFLPSPVMKTIHFTDHVVDNVGQNTICPSKPQVLDQCRSEERLDDSKSYANGSHPRKSAKGSSSRLKDKDRSFKSEYKVKNSSSLNQLQDRSPSFEAKHGDGKTKLQENLGVKSDGTENKNVGKKKDSEWKLSNESSKRERLSGEGYNCQDATAVLVGKHDSKSISQNLLLDCDDERSSKRESTDQGQKVFDREKPLPLPPAGGAQNETFGRCPRPASGSLKGNGVEEGDASKVDDTTKLLKRQIRKTDHQNGTQDVSSRNPTPNGHRSKDLDAPSPARRDSSSHAANNDLKEAKDLKHLADRLKHSGSTLESIGLYFEASLKFLRGASLLESINSENAQSKHIYSSTANLCEFCAREYEKLKDMAAAALAYKCMEVAYMRVIYSSHTNASRDRQELQKALQMIPPGESPSSSASDVDNVNNCTIVDKVALRKGVSSPHVAGMHIAPRNRPHFEQLLSFAQDINLAMEASRKSQIAFAAANASSVETKHTEGIRSIKRALDFSFQDVEGLLRLVRLAMEAINR